MNRQNWHRDMDLQQPRQAQGYANAQAVHFQDDWMGNNTWITPGTTMYNGAGLGGRGEQPTITPTALETRLRNQLTPGMNGGGYEMQGTAQAQDGPGNNLFMTAGYNMQQQGGVEAQAAQTQARQRHGTAG